MSSLTVRRSNRRVGSDGVRTFVLGTVDQSATTAMAAMPATTHTAKTLSEPRPVALAERHGGAPTTATATTGIAAYWRIEIATTPTAMLAANHGIESGRRRNASNASASAAIWNVNAQLSVMYVVAIGPHSGLAATVTATSTASAGRTSRRPIQTTASSPSEARRTR